MDIRPTLTSRSTAPRRAGDYDSRRDPTWMNHSSPAKPPNKGMDPTANVPRKSRHLKLTREVSNGKKPRAKKDRQISD
jgi:hypothetical protein